MVPRMCKVFWNSNIEKVIDEQLSRQLDTQTELDISRASTDIKSELAGQMQNSMMQQLNVGCRD